MKRLLALCILALTLHFAFGAVPYTVGDTLYIWAKSGLNIRSAPSIKGQKLERFVIDSYLLK